ncbi:MAG: hypothetical protein KKH92_02055 [Firmicutes bacterium]|nr:hypothetical protein [Bacillota bacterium]
MKKWMMLIMITFSLVFLSSCIKVVSMSDMELILIDEGFSIIEYQESQINELNLFYEREFNYNYKFTRAIEGRMNQVTQVYIIEFDGQRQAIEFTKLIDNEEELDIVEFDYYDRIGNIVILAISEEVLSLFQDV